MAMALTSYLPTAISALPVAAYCIFFTIVTSAVYSVIYNGFFHPLANVPGPISAKVFPLWTANVLYRQRLNTEMAKLHAKYGPIVRVGPNELSFTSLEAHDTIYRIPFTKSRAGHYFSKDGTLQDTFTTLIFSAPTIGTVNNRILHRRLRNRMAPAFTPKATMAQQPIHDAHMEKMMSDLDALVKQNEPINLTDHLSNMLWNLVSDLSFGEPLVEGKRETFQGLEKMYTKMFGAIEIANHVFPWLEWLVLQGSKFVPNTTAMAFLPAGRLRECLSRQDGRQDFLTAIMGAHGKDEDLQLGWADIYSNASFFIVSGYFTNEISHSALLYQLLRDPSSMQRLKREVCSAFSSLDSISAERCISLPFLNACIQESLRLLPPLAGKFMSRKSPGATIDGLWVPYGTQVYCEAYTMQRSPLYWTDPDSFRPDRWLDNGPESRHAHDVRHSFKPFSSGPRTCIGREMALQTLRLTTAKLVYKYDMESERPDCFVWERDCASSALWSNYRLPVRMALRPKDG